MNNRIITALSFFVAPVMVLANSFAIVIDRTTYSKAKDAVENYRKAVEHDGLKTYLIAAEWANPSQVRDSLKALYNRDKTLEGCVLVGDIPIAMIRNAQHMTTAFKMNEQTFPIRESSVPSDRFYDDLHLKFKYLSQDKEDSALYYYKLTEDSPQRLNPNFYSARIRYPEGKNGDKYQAIADFLNKAAKAKYAQPNKLDQVVSYNGASYNMDCLMVYMDEEKAYRENFPLAFQNGTGFKHWNFRMNHAMRNYLLSELKRDGIDVFMFHEHGAPDQQLVNGNEACQETSSRLASVKREIYSHTKKRAKKGESLDSLQQMFSVKFGLAAGFWNDYANAEYWKKDSIAHAESYISLPDLENIVSNPTFVMFDACYNGSFQDKDQIAGRYIFNPGSTLVVQGNTRNVLQDRWTIEMIGLLSHGIRVGQYNKLVATLEGHLIGDPTVRFAPISANTVSMDIMTKADNRKYWNRLTKSKYPDIQSLALRMLADCDFGLSEGNEKARAATSAMLLSTFRTSPFNTVRMEALKMLSRYGGEDFTEAVRLGLNDPYERIARSSADYAGRIGDVSLLPDIVRVLFEDEDRIRIQYQLNTSLFLFPKEKVIDEVHRYLSASNRMDKKAEMEKAVGSIADNFAFRDRGDSVIMDAKAKTDKRISAIRFLRNNPRTQSLDTYLAFLNDTSVPQNLRVLMAEALGWFDLSCRKADIRSFIRKMLVEGQPDELKEELLQTLERLR